jgi:hypothetical protein
MKQCMNWNRIIANAGLAFFTSLTANIATGNAFALETSSLMALIMAGLAFFTEMKLETEGGTAETIQKAINRGLLV